jgi:hypothetical protein
MTNYWAGRTSLMEGGLLHDPSINQTFDAGWSSPVARQAHNLKVVGSNPTPATKLKRDPCRVPLAFWDTLPDQAFTGVVQC